MWPDLALPSLINLARSFLSKIGESQEDDGHLFIRAQTVREWDCAIPFYSDHLQGIWEVTACGELKRSSPIEKLPSITAPCVIYPVGTIGFGGRNRSISKKFPLLAKPLIMVDLLKRFDSWHFMFNLFEDSLEEELDYAPREQIRNALNETIGEALIVDTPETLWPDIFKKP